LPENSGFAATSSLIIVTGTVARVARGWSGRVRDTALAATIATTIAKMMPPKETALNHNLLVHKYSSLEP
jgi:hypothetical protein